MAFTYIGTANNVASGAGTTLDVSYTVTAGSLLAAFCKHEGTAGTISVAYSDASNSFTAGTQRWHSNNDTGGQWFYLLASTGGAVTVRLTTESKAHRTIILFEYSYGGGNTCAFDAENTAQGTSTAPNSGNFTTTGSGSEVVFGGYAEYTTDTLTSPLINGLAADGSVILSATNWTAAWRRIFSSTFTGAASATISGADPWCCLGIAFKEVTGGAAYNAVPLLDHYYRMIAGR
jgi:hypothetical protein